jgi:hypothetical protein
MFERYTEKARRVIFFARYEASTYGSPEIDAEHLLLGLLREDMSLCCRWLSRTNVETVRRQIDEFLPKLPSISTNIELPLSSAARRILKHAADEADRLANKHIGTEHLFLGLLDEEDCLGTQLLREGGADAATLRSQFADVVRERGGSSHFESIPGREHRSVFAAPIEIHHVRRDAQQVRDAVQHCRMYNWHWEKRSWTNVDIVKEKKTGKVSSSRRGLGKPRTCQRRIEERSLLHLRLGTIRVANGRRPRHGLHKRPLVAVPGVLFEILGALRFPLVPVFRHHIASKSFLMAVSRSPLWHG